MGYALTLAVVVLGVAGLVTLYNRIVTLENRVENAWGQIDVQLRRRADLVPNLVATVEGYAAHEREAIEAVSNARRRMVHASGPDEGATAANELQRALGRVFAVGEAYPDLKADATFTDLQARLAEVEAKIAYARQFFNDAVLRYNDAIQTIPGVLLAPGMGKRPHVYLEVDDATRAVPDARVGDA